MPKFDNEMKYGKRPDGSPKGDGFFGKLNRPDGSVSTEISIGVDMKGKEVTIPLIVPTLNKKELEHLLNTDVESKDFLKKMPPSIMEKAYEHANARIKSGLSPFARPNEIVKPPVGSDYDYGTAKRMWDEEAAKRAASKEKK